MDAGIRVGAKQFYDNQRFSRGFHKAGDFTLQEADLLSRFGKTLSDLEQGAIAPETAEEQHFLLVLQQQAEPETLFERTWLKYIRLSRGRLNFHPLSSRVKGDATMDDLTDDVVAEDD